MRIDVVTLFPEMFPPVWDASILGRARAGGLLELEAHQIRDYSRDKHKRTDDYPFGGGAGLVMTPQPLCDAIDDVKQKTGDGLTVYLTPQGQPLDQSLAGELAREEHLILVCGHYEGIDQRVIDSRIDREISIGDFVLTGGELGAMVLIDCVARLVPGVLGNGESARDESFSGDGLLEYPQYTRPAEYEGMRVPEPLLCGDHAKIEAWRRGKAIEKTARVRPELIDRAGLTPKEKAAAQAVLRPLRKVSIARETAFPEDAKALLEGVSVPENAEIITARDGELLGVLVTDGKTVLHLFVRDGFRFRGIGKKLLDVIGDKENKAFVPIGDRDAQRFFKKCGFFPCGSATSGGEKLRVMKRHEIG